ncbi:hypothetical protein [Sedimentitalea todarodis]|uniref:Uncharacterized protein n=1 Tax=Sedimentitalea todarodis TaxID=1631240 RepID=A0ABU3V8C0_9RHOB|nr:hypothetical protein [Sedimentitalea todarodis]MDU9002415.1 hypothetical protein [Sedimentitalea todarodis]
MFNQTLENSAVQNRRICYDMSSCIVFRKVVDMEEAERECRMALTVKAINGCLPGLFDQSGPRPNGTPVHPDRWATFIVNVETLTSGTRTISALKIRNTMALSRPDVAARACVRWREFGARQSTPEQAA